jgi:hypothetical protein
MVSCSISKYTAPPFTDLDKILELKPGQTLKEVNETLKIKPYDIVYSHDKGKLLLIYNYRVKDRRMALRTTTAAQVIHSETAQRAGDVWYNTDYRELYVLTQDDKVMSIYGEDVLAVGGPVEAMNAHLNGDVNSIATSGKATNEDFQFAQNTYLSRKERKSSQIEEDTAAKKKRNILLGGGALGVIILFKAITN